MNSKTAEGHKTMELPETPNLSVHRTRNGLGIFTKRKFKGGEIVSQIRGTMISVPASKKLDRRTDSNTYRFNRDYYLSPKGKLGEYFNHSCNPNAGVMKRDGKLFIKAIKEIGAEKEILIDYSTILADDEGWKMKCNCGAKGCRGIIRKFSELPTSVKNKHLKLKMAPPYIYKK